MQINSLPQSQAFSTLDFGNIKLHTAQLGTDSYIASKIII